jgi:predicted RNase H-like HicB family nuclease
MTLYPALIDGEGDVWGVVIPDFPGCHGGGSTPEAALKDASSALREFATLMLADGEPLPEPTPLDEVLQRATQRPNEGVKNAGAVYVRLVLDKARPVRANISLDAGLLEAIDGEAKRRGLTRSGFLASAALGEIERGG